MSSQTTSRYQVQTWRVLIVYGVIIAVVGVLTSRLFSLQVLEAQTWVDQAIDNYKTEISDPAARGIIYDGNGYILARNVASYNVTITPVSLPDDTADIQNNCRELSALIDVPVNEGDVEYAKLFGICVPGPGIALLVETAPMMGEAKKQTLVQCPSTHQRSGLKEDSGPEYLAPDYLAGPYLLNLA